MILTLGKNIRALRKQLDITQEQLADKLGVSYQSVSRWENGVTYPDMELLPALAKIFSISVDTLLGIQDAEKEEQAKETFLRLRREVLKKEWDIPAIAAIIQDVRRNYLDSKHIWMFWCMGNDRCYRHPDILPEVRLTAEAFLDSCKTELRYTVIAVMSRVEDETHIAAFLQKYATAYDISEDSLLLERYRANGDREKYDPQRQYCLFQEIDRLCNDGLYHNVKTAVTPEEALSVAQFQLNAIHSLCQTVPSEQLPVSGNGQLDFWIYERLEAGFRIAARLCELKQQEKVFPYLEDCTGLIEKIMGIQEPIKLACSSIWLKNFVWDAEPGWNNKYNNPDGPKEYNVWIHEERGNCWMIYPSTYYQYVTSDKQTWKGFDAIREDARFQELVRRLQAQIKTRNPPDP